MTKASGGGKGRAYQTAVTAAGLCLWAAAAFWLATGYELRDQLVVLALVPVIAVVGMFPISFPLPSGLKLAREQVNFTLSDAFVLLVACWYGVAGAAFVAGIEGLTASLRGGRRLSSNLFSSGMMALATAAATACLHGVLSYGFGGGQTFTAVAVALLAASLVQVVVNLGLLSTLVALRHGDPVLRTWKENFLCAAPMFLPTSAAASLLYLALQHGNLTIVVIVGPVFVAIHFGHRQYRDHVRERIRLMEEANRERLSAVEGAHRQTIEALAVAINAKDEVTHEHVLRVQIYAAGVARLLGCTEAEVEALRAGALLHDIGKIAVPDYILNKPGKLTAEEFDRMKLHTVAGAQILSRVEFPYPVVPVVRSHHERWDGRGYPDGLKGEQIPLTARILSVVDCFDAVREDRQYRRGMTREEAVKFIMEGSGAQYDPRVVGTFVTHLPEFEAEIQARRHEPLPTYGIEPMEQLSHAALKVEPAAGLADEKAADISDTTALNLEDRAALERLSLDLGKHLLEGARVSDEEIIAAFVGQLASLVPFDTCAFARASEGEPRVVYASGRDASLLEGRRVTPGEGVTGWALANRKPFCNTDPRLDLPAEPADRFADYRTLAVFPVLDGPELLGCISLYSVALREYDARHQLLLREAAATLARALTRRQDAPPLPTAQTLTTVASDMTH